MNENDIYKLTSKGDAEIRSGRTTVSPLCLELLVRLDGVTSLASLRFVMPDVPYQTLLDAVEILRRDELIEYTDHRDDVLQFDLMSGVAGTEPIAPPTFTQDEATQSFASLTGNGYFVRIARRPTARPTLPKDRAPIVLIVEDEPVLARFLSHYMRLEGFEVRAAGDRAAIVDALRQPPRPDLVLLDVMLPDVDGFDVLQKIRQHPSLTDMPVMMITAMASRDAVIKGLWRGADGYLTKPFQPDVLTKAIRTIFGVEERPRQ